jgi:hypothetical protein
MSIRLHEATGPRNHGARALAPVLLIFLSGCTGDSTTPDCGDACALSSPQPNGPGELAQFEGCSGLAGAIFTRAEVARNAVPSEFEPFETFPGVAAFILHATQCDSVTLNASTHQNVWMAELSAFAYPPTDWIDNESAINYYVLDKWISDASLAGALNAHGVPIRPATFAVIPLGAEPGARLWSVSAPGCAIAFDVARLTDEMAARDGLFYHWLGPKPFHRVESRYEYAYEAIHPVMTPVAPDVIRSEGTCPTATLVGPGIPMVAQAIVKENFRWTMANRTFS